MKTNERKEAACRALADHSGSRNALMELMQAHIDITHEEMETAEAPQIYRLQGKVALAQEILARMKRDQNA